MMKETEFSAKTSSDYGRKGLSRREYRTTEKYKQAHVTASADT